MIHLKILYVIEALWITPLSHPDQDGIKYQLYQYLMQFFFSPLREHFFIFEKITNLVALKGISCKEHLNISASFLSSLGVIYWFQFDDDWALQRRVRGETPIEDPINLSGGKAIGERVC